MLEPGGGPMGLFGQGYFPTSANESCEEEELSVLPRHTKVIVTGNNRTKSVLVGLHGVVKKAVGLGGWHWLVLTNGAEVKLQRNALSVIEAPTGHEEDDDVENPFSNETNIDDYPKSFKPRVRPQKPAYEMPRTADSSVESVSLKRCERKTETGISSYSNSFPIVDLGKLDTSSLRKYRRHFKLFDVDPNCSKEQLLRAVGRHFISYQPDEWRVISGFVDSVKRQRT